MQAHRVHRGRTSSLVLFLAVLCAVSASNVRRGYFGTSVDGGDVYVHERDGYVDAGEELREYLVPMLKEERDLPEVSISSKHSAMECYGGHIDWRSCLVTNMCFDAVEGRYKFFVESEQRRQQWYKAVPQPAIVSEASVDGIYIAGYDIMVGPMPDGPISGQEPLGRQDVRVVEDFSFLMRVHQETYNLYHAIHDDLLPLYQLLAFYRDDVAEYYGEEMESVAGQFDSVDAERSQVMQMGFWSPPNDTYDGMYDYMTKKIVRHARHPSSSPDVLGQRYTCFKKAVWGTLFNSRSFSPGWSDYPITYPHANGLWMRMASDYMLNKIGLPPTTFSSLEPVPTADVRRIYDVELVSAEDKDKLDAWKDFPFCSENHQCTVVLIHRGSTRRLLNYNEVLRQFQEHPGVEKVVEMDERKLTAHAETDTFLEMVEKVRFADVLVGSHGAGLTMGVFMPRGATVVEIVAFGTQQRTFDYFGAMFRIQYTGINYKTWTNADPTLSFRPTTGRAASKEKGILGMDKEDLIHCLRMPAYLKPYTWASRCLHYWKDNETQLPSFAVSEIMSGTRRTVR